MQAAFFQVYSPLSEAPDPYPLLEASVDSLVTSEELVPKLTSENERLQKTVASLTPEREARQLGIQGEESRREGREPGSTTKGTQGQLRSLTATWPGGGH